MTGLAARSGLALIAGLAMLAAATLLPHVVPAAWIAAAATGIALWFALRPRPAPEAPAIAPDIAPEPAFDAVIAAIDDPLLLVERQSVTRANHAARTLLGAYIVGEDVRLAIRHPAAAEKFAARDAADGPPVVLVGLGEHERRWEMSVHGVGGDARLVRLTDRTGTHVAEKMRVDFVANASHELRTPLSTLLGFIETLEDRNAAEDAATRTRFLKIMFGEAKRMQRLVDDLMSLSRIEAERYSLPQAAVSLVPLIAEVRDALRTGIVADVDRVVVEAAPDVPDIIGDRAQISQLLHNLIGNALKYGRAGSIVRVLVQPAPGGMVRLAVVDQGEGIAPEHLPRLTERFYRVDPGRSRGLGGTGLGLAIVKHIVERHRGRFAIDSVVGRGTAVTVMLPVVKPISQAQDALSSRRHEIVTQDERVRTSGLTGPG